ncbi:phage baseplate plug protein [Pectobacterium jejuense]|uniref:phage baseplate plug family protein n=1 Tax=Pectobacterium jejuense TaxID=2974022 RepID=UPI0037FAB413
MNANEIPLTPNNQLFSITLAGTVYQMRILWRETFWSLDLMDSAGGMVAGSIPLITGYDLLLQYAYLNLGFSLIVACDVAGQENPTKTDLGIYSHLYVVTE